MTPEPVVLVGWERTADAAALAVSLATELLGSHPGPLHHRCPLCGSVEHGRPAFDAPVEVSIAHGEGIRLVAVSTAGAVGVDLEPIDAAGAGTRAWVDDEALAKAHGTGLPLSEAARAGDAITVELDVPGHLAALVLLGDEPVEVRVRPGAGEAPGSPARR